MEEKYPLSFLRSVSGSPCDKQFTPEFEKMMSVCAASFPLLDKAASFFYLFDFVKMRYLYVSESIQDVMGGYCAKDWIDNGPEWVLTRVYHEDVRRLKDLHQALFRFFYSLPVQDRKEYKYSWEFRLVRKDGNIIWLMQQGSFIEIDPDGRPMASFDTVSDTTHLKKDNSMSLTMFKDVDSPKLKLYFPMSVKESFTKREIELVKLLSDGFTSKRIADELCISHHTVDTHRRNMLKKCGVNDSIRLVAYARENGMI